MMANPQEIVISTEFWDTLKNDSPMVTSQLTVPGSVSVAGSGIYINSNSIIIGSQRSLADARVNTSRTPGRDYTVTGTYGIGDDASWFGFLRNGSEGFYSIFVRIEHTSSSTITYEVFIPNPYSNSMTGQSGDETFTLKLRTYRAPFI